MDSPPLIFSLLGFSAFVHCLMEALIGLIEKRGRHGLFWAQMTGVYLDLIIATYMASNYDGAIAGLSLWIMVPIRFALGAQLMQILHRFFIPPGETRILPAGRPGVLWMFALAVATVLGVAFFSPPHSECQNLSLNNESCGLMIRAILQISSSLYLLIFLLPAIYWGGRLLFFGSRFQTPLMWILVFFLMVLVALFWEARGLFPELDPTRSTYGIVPLFSCTMGFSLFERCFPRAGADIKEQSLGMAEKRNRLKGHDLQKINENLHRIMEDEKPYLDEDFRLPQLAQMLDLSPQQISYHLNQNLGKDFHSFVCEYRIRDAGRLLLEDDRSVTSIAFAVGFNSRSVFYRMFKETTGLTPSQFRASENSQKY